MALLTGVETCGKLGERQRERGKERARKAGRARKGKSAGKSDAGELEKKHMAKANVTLIRNASNALDVFEAAIADLIEPFNDAIDLYEDGFFDVDANTSLIESAEKLNADFAKVAMNLQSQYKKTNDKSLAEIIEMGNRASVLVCVIVIKLNRCSERPIMYN